MRFLFFPIGAAEVIISVEFPTGTAVIFPVLVQMYLRAVDRLPVFGVRVFLIVQRPRLLCACAVLSKCDR